MNLDELEPIDELYNIKVRPDSEGSRSIRGVKYRTDYVKCPINPDEELVERMINGCLIRWDIASRSNDKKPKKMVAKVFNGFKEIFYSFE